MRYAFALALLASPAAAHEGAHMHIHPHGGESWIALMLLAGAGLLAYARWRK